MDIFHDGVPRGAQTWECPLHTPDILASALLVRAYTLGYELTASPGSSNRLDIGPGPVCRLFIWSIRRRLAGGRVHDNCSFWSDGMAGSHLGGLPVQWCGLVYANALYRLERHDPEGPWKQLADGITESGLQQTWPASNIEYQGLLPDSFVLRAQHRNGPAINPATVEACAVRYLRQTPAYDFWSFRQNHLYVHAPGAIMKPGEKKGRSVSRLGLRWSIPIPCWSAVLRSRRA